MATWDSYKSRNYVDAYEEAHRRTPTVITVPLLESHFSIWHPEHFDDVFPWYMTNLLTYLVGLESGAEQIVHLQRIDHWVDQIYKYYKDTETPNVVQRLVFHFQEVDANRLWRLEVHREYSAVTIFHSLDDSDVNAIRDEEQTINVPRSITSSPYVQHIVDEINNRKASFVDCLIASTHQFFLVFGEVLAAGEDASAAINESVLSRRLSHPQIPRRRVDRERFERYKKNTVPQIMADYFGIVLPISVFQDKSGSRDVDFFPDVESEGLADPSQDRSGKLLRAANFLDEVLSESVMKTRLIRRRNPANTVACYLLDGHFLFISPLGARQDDGPNQGQPMGLGPDEMDKSAGLFWVFYRDFRRLGRHPRNERGYPTDRRASRLLYMLNVIGTTRIAALHNMQALKDFSQRLRRLESEAINLRLHGGRRAIVDSRRFRMKLMDAERRVNESIIYRASRTSYYQDIMQIHIEDTRAIAIPSWQKLDNYIRRRLAPSLSYLASLGTRYESLNRLVVNEYAINIGAQIYRIQFIADSLIAVLALYYTPHALENVGRSLKFLWEMFVEDRVKAGDVMGSAPLKAVVSVMPEMLVTIGVLFVLALYLFNIALILRRWVGRRLRV